MSPVSCKLFIKVMYSLFVNNREKLPLLTFPTLQQAGKGCDQRTHTADIHTQQQLPVILRKLAQQNGRRHIADKLAGQNGKQQCAFSSSAEKISRTNRILAILPEKTKKNTKVSSSG